MNKYERIHLISVAAKLETVIEELNRAIEPINNKDMERIICEQITAIYGVIDDILIGGESNGQG